MESDTILSCRKTFERYANEIYDIAKSYNNATINAKFNSFMALMKSRFDDFNPKITIYGIYNAGKSTLVNGLTGRDQAPVADVPTTDKIIPYKWNEYTIYDTPGINAPIEHESLSKKHIAESDVILFVLDTEGAFNFGKNYRELTEIVESRKQVLIVLNNKSGYDIKKEDGQRELAKIVNHIYEDFSEMYVSSHGNIQDKFSIIIVNAKLAFKARCSIDIDDQKREKFLEASNIKELEMAIVNEYAKVNSFSILKQLEKGLLDCVEILRSHLENCRKQLSNKDGTMDLLLKEHDQILNKCEGEINRNSRNIENLIYNCLENVQSAESINENILEIIEKWYNQVAEYTQSELQNFQRKHKSVADKSLIIKPNIFQTHNSLVPVDLKSDEYSSNNSIVTQNNKDRNLSDAQYSDSTQNCIKGMVGGEVATLAARGLLPMTRMLPLVGIPLAKLLAVAIPAIIPFVLVYSMFGKSNKEKEEEQKRQMLDAQYKEQLIKLQVEQHQKEILKEKAKTLVMNCENEILNSVRKYIDESFSPLLQNEELVAKQHSEEDEKVVSDSRKLFQLKDNVTRLMSQY